MTTNNNLLTQITALIDRFNKESETFRLDLFINKKEFAGRLTFTQIMERVCKKTGLTPEYLNMKSREPKIVLPRQICHYIANKRSGKSLAEIGLYFGGKDHATVLNSTKKVQNMLDTDKEFRNEWYEFLTAN